MCAGTEEDRGKGGTPKGQISCGSVAWAWGEKPHDCHLKQMRRYPVRDDSSEIESFYDIQVLERRTFGTPLIYSCRRQVRYPAVC